MRVLLIAAAVSMVSSDSFAEAKPRLHPTKHFESFSEISFNDDDQNRNEEIAGLEEDIDEPDFEGIADANAKPIAAKAVKVNPKHVTNAEYQKFVQETGHTAPPHWVDGKPPVGKEDKPVVNVSYKDAQDYAKWANKNLPSQTDWMSSADQLSWDLEIPKNEWTSTPSLQSIDGLNQVLVSPKGEMSEMNSLERSLDTGFRVSSPIEDSLDLSRERGNDVFQTPEGGTILPDQDIESPAGNIKDLDSNPYDYGH